MVQLKKRKYMTNEDTKKLKKKTENKLELAELKRNLWRCYREGGKMIHPEPKNGEQAEKEIDKKEKVI